MIIPIKPWLERTEDHGPSMTDFYRYQEEVALASDAELEAFRKGEGISETFMAKIAMSERAHFYHKSVLGQEVLHAMRPVKGKQIFDGTLGGGGHSELLLQNGAHVIGCDQDKDALVYACRRLESYGDCFLPVRGNFADMDVLLSQLGIDSIDGVLLDLGVSSHQLDEAERGFSFQSDGPLDMRMDQGQGKTAADLVNNLDEKELADIFYQYGEERKSRRVAKAIVEAREDEPIETTLQLAQIVAKVIPRTGSTNPATRVFQGLRIAVNRELEVLEQALEKAVSLLTPGGVIAVITFHSLEDRIVKQFMRKCSTPLIDRPEWPEPRRNPDFSLSLRNRRAIVASEEEVNQNPRARSAKLRAATKLSQ